MRGVKQIPKANHARKVKQNQRYTGAGDEIRTRDSLLGKQALYH
jgi:hypothetical protein